MNDTKLEIQREKLSLTTDQAKCILYGDVEVPEFEVVEDEVIDNSRWSIIHKLVIKRLSDGKFFADGYRTAATENQDESPWEYIKSNFTQVFAVEKKIIVYE